MLSALVFLLVITVSVVIHELAHYFNARSVGVPVKAFSVGMGPILWKRRWRETEWRLSAIPLGGYVDLDGMVPEEQADGTLAYPDRGFAQKNVWQKIWVLIGGVIANFILAVLLLAWVVSAAPQSFIASQVTRDPSLLSGTRLESIVPGSPAAQLGLKAGDEVLRLNGLKEPNPMALTAEIQQAKQLKLLVKRQGQTRQFLLTPWPPPNAERPARLGVTIAPLHVAEIPFARALVDTTGFLVRIVPESVRGIVGAFTSTFAGERSEEVMGPVGMIGLAGEAAKGGWLAVLTFAGLINFSLAVFNLMPIPGLDGGRILFALAAALRGKPFKPGQEEMVNFLGIAFLLLFVLFISIGEVGDIVGR